jgi:hypothetical protein
VIGELGGKGIYGLVSDFKDWEKEMDWIKRLSLENRCQINFVLFFREVRAAILAEPLPLMGEAFMDTIIGGYDKLYELGDPPNYEPAPEDSIAASGATACRWNRWSGRRLMTPPAALAWKTGALWSPA